MVKLTEMNEEQRSVFVRKLTTDVNDMLPEDVHAFVVLMVHSEGVESVGTLHPDHAKRLYKSLLSLDNDPAVLVSRQCIDAKTGDAVCADCGDRLDALGQCLRCFFKEDKQQ